MQVFKKIDFQKLRGNQFHCLDTAVQNTHAQEVLNISTNKNNIIITTLNLTYKMIRGTHQQ